MSNTPKYTRTYQVKVIAGEGLFDTEARVNEWLQALAKDELYSTVKKISFTSCQPDGAFATIVFTAYL